MPDRPFARREVTKRNERGQRKQNGDSTFHLALEQPLVVTLLDPLDPSHTFNIITAV
jgi:hypothetical protein